jgi:glucuronosyltransferase
MSFGSNAKTSFFSEQIIEDFLEVFSKLKQRVVMKWENKELKGKPENVFIAKWLPQDDILAHQNVKLFISHCGLGSITEARYHGVPILAIPLFGDQPENADQIAREGWSVKMDLSTLNRISLQSSITELLQNQTYAENVKKLSKIIRDRPTNSHELALYWIDYVIRHEGATHLHYPGADLNNIQRVSIDLIILFMVMIGIAIKGFSTIFRVCLRKKDSKNMNLEIKKKI